MKSPDQRGPTGAWAYAARQEAGLSVEQVVDALEAQGLTVSAATIRGVEGGSKKPGARLLRLLGKVLASPPPSQAAPEQDDLTAILAAMQATLEAQRQELKALRGLVTVLALRSPSPATDDPLVRLADSVLAELPDPEVLLGSKAGS